MTIEIFVAGWLFFQEICDIYDTSHRKYSWTGFQVNVMVIETQMYTLGRQPLCLLVGLACLATSD